MWISYAKFEASAGLDGSERDDKAQFENGDISYQEQQTEQIQRCRGKLRVFFCFLV